MRPNPPLPSSESPDWDPVFLNSRREAVIIFCLWLAGFAWAVPFCYFTGYIRDFDPETFSTTFGIPTWLFWGVLIPWIVADLFTTWFCFCYMRDDNLGEAHEGADIEEEIAELHAARDAEEESNS